MQTERHAQTDRRKDRQADRKIDRQTVRRKDRQTDTDRWKDKHADGLSETKIGQVDRHRKWID